MTTAKVSVQLGDTVIFTRKRLFYLCGKLGTNFLKTSCNIVIKCICNSCK